jgi:hypothetical protein
LVSEKEAHKIIMSSPSKSSVQDPIPTWLVKKCLKALLPAITMLINSCITHGLPHEYKRAIIIPLMKKGVKKPNEMASYRPVSNLPFLAKAVERAVTRRLTNYLESNNLHDPMQFAYRKYHSCETAMLTLFDKVCSAADSGEVTILVLLDLTSAFDTVSHSTLTQCLIKAGVQDDALTWFKSYVSSRSTVVCCNGKQSPPYPLLHGVPQGSVLGPILFILYLRDISDIFKRHAIHYIVYADDIQLFLSATPSNIQAAISRLEVCIIEALSRLSSK